MPLGSKPTPKRVGLKSYLTLTGGSLTGVREFLSVSPPPRATNYKIKFYFHFWSKPPLRKGAGRLFLGISLGLVRLPLKELAGLRRTTPVGFHPTG